MPVFRTGLFASWRPKLKEQGPGTAQPVRWRLLKDLGLQKSHPAELNLIGLNELQRMDRWVLERRSRALVQTAFLGNQLTLCRVLGRYKLFIPTTDIGFGAHVIMDGVWEPWLTVFMASRIKAGMNVVDAGANHGYYTVLFADLVGPKGRVAAFEPNPKTVELLTRTVVVNGFDSRVTIFDKALTAADDETLLFFAPTGEPKNARIMEPQYVGHPDTLTVTGAKLDTLLADWPRIDFMKVDVEGAEEAMLKGAWETIARDRPQLLLEFNAERCADPAGLLDRLEAVYGGRPSVVSHASALEPVERAALLDPDHSEDWLLYFTPL